MQMEGMHTAPWSFLPWQIRSQFGSDLTSTTTTTFSAGNLRNPLLPPSLAGSKPVWNCAVSFECTSECSSAPLRPLPFSLKSQGRQQVLNYCTLQSWPKSRRNNLGQKENDNDSCKSLSHFKPPLNKCSAKKGRKMGEKNLLLRHPFPVRHLENYNSCCILVIRLLISCFNDCLMIHESITKFSGDQNRLTQILYLELLKLQGYRETRQSIID